MIDFNNAPNTGMEMLPYERFKLYNWIIDIKPINIIEIGCGLGGTTYYISESIKTLNIESTIYTCDPSRSPSSSLLKDFPFIKYYPITSNILIEDVISNNIDIDFILFDGPELPDIALDDIKILENYIKNGTYFCMHDWEFTKRGYDNGISTKSEKIRPYIEKSKKWIEIEVLSGLIKNSNYNNDIFDSVGLCLYKFKK